MAFVNDFDQFKLAILDLDDDTIVLTNDIEGLVGGVIIPTSKTNLIIDGLNPNTGQIHTFTDYNSASFSDTVRLLSASGVVNILIKNLNIVCRNYYGIVSINNSPTTSNVNLMFENIVMLGEQLAYNRYGTTTIENADAIIRHIPGSLSIVHELAETNRLVLKGNINVLHESLGNSCIYFTNSNSKLEVENSAVVNITINNRELVFSENPIDVEFGESCIFNLITNHGMFYNLGNHRARNFLVKRNAYIYIRQLSRNTYVPTIRLEGGMTLEEDVTFKVFVPYGNADSLIYMNNNATLNFINPKRIVLYNYGGQIFEWANQSGTINFVTHIVNYWLNANSIDQAGTIDDQPLYNYKKYDNSNLEIAAQVLNGITTSTTTNYVIDEDGPDLLDNTTFDTTVAHMITLGKLPLTVEEITDSSESINGITTPLSTIRYTNEAIIITDVNNEAGVFELELMNPPVKNTKVILIANNDYLNHRFITKVVGSLRFYQVPEQMIFNLKCIPPSTSFIFRRLTDWCLSVIDTRDNGSPWQLYASIDHELASETEEIPQAVIYKSILEQVLSGIDILIFEGEGNIEETTITDISWNKEAGILLKLDLDRPCIGGRYKTLIQWRLVSM